MLKRLLLATSFLALVLPGAAGAADRCGKLMKFTLQGMDLKITLAKELPAGPMPKLPFGQSVNITLPPYCRIEGVIDQRIGADGKSYGVKFAVALPDNWSGQFLFEGGGGLDGVLIEPTGKVDSATMTGTGGKPGLTRGMAIATTDSGHESKRGFDASFFADQQATLDFEYASIGKVTNAAKAIIARYYGSPAHHSYFAGCSMGGREAMIAAQRYPLEFDGVVSGAPAQRVGYSTIGDRWVTVMLNRAAPKDKNGKAIPDQALSDGDRKLIIDRLLDACDAQDGLKDGMIFNPKACKFDPAKLACSGKKTDKCLSHAQVDALHRAFAGPKDSRGNPVYPPFPYDAGIAVERGIPGLINPKTGPLGPPLQDTALDVDAALRALDSDAGAATGDTSRWTNLSSFAARGGKIMFFHGISDPWFSVLDTVGYFERMKTANGGEKAESFARLFLSPGMGHCGGGPGLDDFDMLTPIIDWVEHGQAPESVIATGPAFPGRSRPLCAYPRHAQYKGSGDPQDAANFECKD